MIRIAAASEDPSLDRFALQCSGANAYHMSAWRRIIARSFAHQSECLVSEDPSGAIDGFLPMVKMSSRLFGDFVVSMPYVNYGGPCTARPEVSAALATAAASFAAEHRVRHLELRAVDLLPSSLPSRVSKVSLRLPLPSSAEDLWKALGSKLRSQIKRAQKEEMHVEIGNSPSLLRDFYIVFATNMRDLGTPVYSRRFFEHIVDELPDSATTCVVRLGEAAVAAGFLIGFGSRLEIPWASSLRAYSHLSPNMLLYWSVLKYACDRGYGEFDFGRSSPDSGTYRFKTQWGARPLPLHWHYWVPPGDALPELSPSNPRYQMAIRIWQRLPVHLTTLIGPAIVRGLP